MNLTNGLRPERIATESTENTDSCTRSRLFIRIIRMIRKLFKRTAKSNKSNKFLILLTSQLRGFSSRLLLHKTHSNPAHLCVRRPRPWLSVKAGGRPALALAATAQATAHGLGALRGAPPTNCIFVAAGSGARRGNWTQATRFAWFIGRPAEGVTEDRRSEGRGRLPPS
jgi:hypothetical protein